MGKKITTNIDMDGNEIERPSMHKLSSPPSNPVEGQFYYDTTSKTSYIWNGTGWVPMKGLGSEEYYGVCSTSEYTNIKTVSIPSVTELSVGLVVTIKFTKRNGVGSPKLKINDFTEKQMMLYGITAFGTTDETNGWYAGSILTFVYDGSYFVMSGKPNTDSTYSNPSFMNVYGKHLSSSTGTNISVVNRTGNNIDLKENGYLTVKFEIDVLSNAVMRVSNGGSHPIYHRGNPITTGVINAGDTALFIYKGLITDGNWELLAIDKGVMQGATDNSNGKQGYVPAPQAGDNEKFLKGDGTWGDVPNKVMQVYLSGLINTEYGMIYTESTHSYDDVWRHINNKGIVYINTEEGFSYQLIGWGIGAVNPISFYKISIVNGSLKYSLITCTKGIEQDTWKIKETDL